MGGRASGAAAAGTPPRLSRKLPPSSPSLLLFSVFSLRCTAAEYFKVRLIRLPVGPDYRLSGAAVRAALSRNTVLVVASSPGFPHGVMDHVEDIAEAR